eukprot:scaffold25855_cov112-Isochrysis_galbana.AAC.1
MPQKKEMRGAISSTVTMPVAARAGPRVRVVVVVREFVRWCSCAGPSYSRQTQRDPEGELQGADTPGGRAWRPPPFARHSGDGLAPSPVSWAALMYSMPSANVKASSSLASAPASCGGDGRLAANGNTGAHAHRLRAGGYSRRAGRRRGQSGDPLNGAHSGAGKIDPML